MQPCPFVELPQPPPAVAQANPAHPAIVMVIGILVAVLIFDVWALSTHHHTISQLLQHLSKGHHWFRWFGAALITILGWHLFWGFPW